MFWQQTEIEDSKLNVPQKSCLKFDRAYKIITRLVSSFNLLQKFYNFCKFSDCDVKEYRVYDKDRYSSKYHNLYMFTLYLKSAYK